MFWIIIYPFLVQNKDIMYIYMNVYGKWLLVYSSTLGGMSLECLEYKSKASTSILNAWLSLVDQVLSCMLLGS